MQWIKLDQNTITDALFSQLEYLESVYDLDTFAWLDGETLAGFITLQPCSIYSGGGIYIVNLNVNPAYRRQGLGRSLMLTALSHYGCSHQGKHVILDVSKSNPPALSLYKKLGFQITDIPSGNGPSDYVMIAPLDQLIDSCATPRLVLKPIIPEDAPKLGAILREDIVKATYMVPELDVPAAEKLALRIINLSYDPKRYVRGVYCKNELIGALNDVEVCDGTMELGWFIAPAEHNKGYATEAVSAAISNLFTKGYQRIIAGAFSENKASIRVMEKAGMHPISKTEDIEYRNAIHKCVFFERSKT